MALKCPLINREVKLKYLRLIKSDDNTESVNKRQRGNNMDLHSYFDSDRIDAPKISRANQTMVCFFVCCGIPFSVADSPFFHDFTKTLCSGYEPPKHTTLSNHLLGSEIANMTLKIEKEVHDSKNLTLGN